LSVVARQLGFGQLPIRPYFAHIVKPREKLSSDLEYNRLSNLAPDTSTINLEPWTAAAFTIKQFKLWWKEWKNHLFCVATGIYCKKFDLDFNDPDGGVITIDSAEFPFVADVFFPLTLLRFAGC